MRSLSSFLCIHTTSLRARLYLSIDCSHRSPHVSLLPHHWLIISKFLKSGLSTTKETSGWILLKYGWVYVFILLLLHKLINKYKGWRDGLAAKSACCFDTGLEFSSQRICQTGSQTPITSALGDLNPFLWGSMGNHGTTWTYSYTHINIKCNLTFLKYQNRNECM